MPLPTETSARRERLPSAGHRSRAIALAPRASRGAAGGRGAPRGGRSRAMPTGIIRRATNTSAVILGTYAASAPRYAGKADGLSPAP